MNGLIAVTEDISTAGAIVWWKLSGSMSADRLREEWVAAGLEPARMPSTPTPQVAMRRAVAEQREARRLVRSLERGKGYAIVDETAKGNELDYEVGLRIKLDQVGRLVFETDRGWDSAVRKVQEEIRDAFTRHQNEMSSYDMSEWLVSVMARLDGVSLREAGGVYFVPAHQVAAWGTMRRAIGAASDTNKLYEVPALKSTDAIEAVLDAISDEARREADQMERELEENGMGARAIETRIARCEGVTSKVQRYEGLLGRRLEDLQGRLEALRANLTVAMVKANQEAGGESLSGLLS